jgi:hypothetical protein
MSSPLGVDGAANETVGNGLETSQTTKGYGNWQGLLKRKNAEPDAVLGYAIIRLNVIQKSRHI